MEFRLLGPLEVRDDRGAVVALPRRQQRALLAALLLRVGTVVSTDRLVDDLWGERPPARAVGSLQNTVSQLRRAFGDDVLRTRPPGYVLDVPAEAVDARRFEHLLAHAAGQDAAARAGSLREALALWRGPALADLGDAPWVRTEVERLEGLRLTAIEERIEAELELGRHALFVAQLEALSAEHPLRERLRRQLALALYRSGRQADALEACRSARHALDELGLEPSAELRELERDILRQSAHLAAPAIEVAEEPEAVAGERRVVSVLAADVGEEEDPEALRATLARVLDAATIAIARHGGTIERFGPDGLTAVFGADERHEDDALRAVRAAVELHEAAGIAVAVATGDAIVAEEPHVATAAIGRAAELARSSEGVLVDPRSHDLVRDAVTVDGARIVRVRPDRPDARADVALVGRQAELSQLRDAFGLAASERRCVSLVVVGEPGIGKSRLARELAGSIEAEVLAGRCAAYGEGATFLPLVEALPDLGDAPTESTSLGEYFWAVRRLLEARAEQRPVALLLDDVHWAQPALLDLVEYLEARVREAPLFLLCLARPELLEQRPGWAAGALTLAPLGPDETRELVAASGRGLDEEAREQIVSLAEGNALYAQQLAAFAAESGKALEPDAMPATLEAVLAGRLARLEAGERATLQRAAVVGREFARGAVAALAPADLAVDAHLLSLSRRGFVHPADPVPGDDNYRFHHVLLRDAAYATLTKEQRADLHERVAAWLDRDGAGDDVVVGYHLEQAARYLADVGRPAEELAASAGERLGRAGIRAWSHNDGSAALNLLERSARLTSAGARRAELEFEWAIVLQTRARPDEAVAALEKAVADAESSGAEHIAVRARLELARLAQLEGRLSPDELLSQATEAIAVLETHHDDRGLARAWIVVSDAHDFRCEMEATGRAAERAAHHYRLAGFSTQAALARQVQALFHGPTPAPAALEAADALLDLASDRGAKADILATIGGLHAMLARFGEARRAAAEAHALYEDVGATISFETSLVPFLIEVERLAGDFDAAATLGHRNVEALLALGSTAHAATGAVRVADIEVARGELDEAERMLETAKATAVSYDVVTRFLILAVRARVLGRNGDHEAAEAAAREAVDLAAQTDALNDRVRTLIALEEALRFGGDYDDARRAAEEAESLLVQKGNIAGIARLQEQLATVTPR